MKLARLATLFAVVFLLSACAVTVQPGTFDVESVIGTSGSPFVNDRLGLRAYPGSAITRQEGRGGSSETTFETRASLADVFDHFDRQLARQGWRRDDTDFGPNRVEAEYRRRGDGEIELSLNRRGNSGSYHLEIDFDD